MADVITWNSQEADMEKMPKVYDDFEYNTDTDGGCLNKLDEVNALINTDVEEIASKYNELQGFYNEFTDYNALMDSNKELLQFSTSEIRDAYNGIVEGMQLQINELQKSSGELIDDLDSINSMLKTDDTTTDATTGDDTTASSGSSESVPTTPTQSVDLSTIADDVIMGKYGTGPDREAALAAIGVDPTEVQAIVNAKLNGTWTGGSTPTVTPSPVVDTPPTPTVTTPDVPATPEVPSTPEVPTTPSTTEAGFMGSGLASSFINAASNWIGTKYVYGGNGNGGIDCSALIQKAAAAVGIDLPRTTGALASVGVQVSRNQVQPGDLIFTNGGKHVQIVSSVNADGSVNAIGASSVAGVVKEQTVRTPITQIRRVV